jgi:hypothetical protein
MRCLTFAPWPGELNNTRLSLECLAVLAVLTRRTLVIPGGYRKRGGHPGGGFLPPHPAEFLDLQRLRQACPWISHQDWLAGTGATPAAETCTLPLAPGGSVFCHPRIPRGTPSALARLGHFAGGRTCLELSPRQRACERLHLPESALEHFAAFFFFEDPAEARRVARLVRDFVQLRPEILQAGLQLAARLGGYDAVHVRKGDFIQYYPQSRVDETELTDRLLSHFGPGGTLYLASDDRCSNSFVGLRKHFQLLRAHDLLDVKRMDGVVLAAVEQVVCACARRFIGTRLSTFSAYISRLRGYFARPDQSLRFTDGSWTEAADESGAPPYSWCNWMHANGPLWARDFREAWSGLDD